MVKQLRRPLFNLISRVLTPATFPATAKRTPLFFPSNAKLIQKGFETPENQFHFNPDFSRKTYSSEPAADKSRCWNCNNPAPFLSCKSCHSVQPIDHSVDYFQIFGLEKKFEIENENLEGMYKDWQKKLHPDLVHSKSEKERVYAAEQSARVIDAYRTLRDPLSRALYIMKLEGMEVDEEKTISETELLGEIMEIREAVEEAVDTQTLDQIKSQVQHKLRHWSDSFATAFRCKNYDEARASIQRMTYYDRIDEEIVKKL